MNNTLASARFLPNAITWSRIVAVPVIVAVFVLVPRSAEIILILMIWCSLSDFIDGKIARRFGTTSQYGSVLDPVADKIYVLGIVGLYAWHEQLPLWFMVVVYLRNVTQLSAVPILNYRRVSFYVKPKLPAKIGTFSNFIVVLGVQILLLFDTSSATRLKDIVDLTLTYVAIPLSFVLELYILITFVARFTQILRHRHDTFE